MKLIEDVPKWVAISFLMLGKLDMLLYNIGQFFDALSWKISDLMTKLRDIYCTCEQCIERKKDRV